MAMYQPAIETMPQDQLRALQSERLVKQVKHVWDNVPYYRQKMEAKCVTPDDIRASRTCTSCPSSPRMTCANATPTVSWQSP